MGEEKYNRIEQNIIGKFKNEIYSQIEPYEKERLGYLRKYNFLTKLIWAAFFVTVIILAVWITSSGKPFSPRIILRIGIGFLVLWTMACKNIGKDFKYNLKSDIVPLICKSFPNLKWITKQSNTKQEYQKSYVIPRFENIKYEDCFIGRYKYTDFLIEEIEALVRGGKFPTAVFTGVVLQFELSNKDIKSHTVIHPSSDLHTIPVKNLNYTQTVNLSDDEKYDVFTNDENQAKILTEKLFSEVLEKVKKAYDAKKIYAAFYNGIFYLGLFTYKKSMQTGSLTKPVYTEEQFCDFTKEIVSILKITDYFNYDENTKV